MDGGTVVPVGHWDSRIGRHRQGRGHTGHLLKGNPIFLQQFQLLAAPAEQEGVTALQAHHPLALLCLFQQNLINPILRNGVVAGLLAHVDFFGGLRD